MSLLLYSFAYGILDLYGHARSRRRRAEAPLVRCTYILFSQQHKEKQDDECAVPNKIVSNLRDAHYIIVNLSCLPQTRVQCVTQRKVTFTSTVTIIIVSFSLVDRCNHGRPRVSGTKERVARSGKGWKLCKGEKMVYVVFPESTGAILRRPGNSSCLPALVVLDATTRNYECRRLVEKRTRDILLIYGRILGLGTASTL